MRDTSSLWPFRQWNLAAGRRCGVGWRKFPWLSAPRPQMPQATLLSRDIGERDPRGWLRGRGNRSRPQACRETAACYPPCSGAAAQPTQACREGAGGPRSGHAQRPGHRPRSGHGPRPGHGARSGHTRSGHGPCRNAGRALGAAGGHGGATRERPGQDRGSSGNHNGAGRVRTGSGGSASAGDSTGYGGSTGYAVRTGHGGGATGRDRVRHDPPGNRVGRHAPGRRERRGPHRRGTARPARDRERHAERGATGPARGSGRRARHGPVQPARDGARRAGHDTAHHARDGGRRGRHDAAHHARDGRRDATHHAPGGEACGA
jgi:hypothetical protein